jgi:hypothetical protein
VPPRARWNDPWTEYDESTASSQPALKHVKENVGSMLNKALEALEDENADALQDVLKGTINFNRKIGQTTLDDDTLVDFIQNFDKIPLRDERLRIPRPAGRRLRMADQALRRLGRQEGGRVLHPGRGGAHLRGNLRPQPKT